MSLVKELSARTLARVVDGTGVIEVHDADGGAVLDVTTEARLWDGLFAATDGNLTVLATSHRPRVLERADVVITLERGRRTG